MSRSSSSLVLTCLLVVPASSLLAHRMTRARHGLPTRTRVVTRGSGIDELSIDDLFAAVEDLEKTRTDAEVGGEDVVGCQVAREAKIYREYHIETQREVFDDAATFYASPMAVPPEVLQKEACTRRSGARASLHGLALRRPPLVFS